MAGRRTERQFTVASCGTSLRATESQLESSYAFTYFLRFCPL